MHREFAFIKSLNSSVIDLVASLANSSTSENRQSTHAAVTQVIRVPQYQDVFVVGELSAPSWSSQNGKGEILVFRATEILVLGGSGVITMDGAGFNEAGGAQGDSTLGLGTSSSSDNGPAGGSGNCAGGTASYGTLGVTAVNSGCGNAGANGTWEQRLR